MAKAAKSKAAPAAEKPAKAAKKTTTKKEKTGPKRPLAAYMIFSQEVRPQVKADNPDATFGDLGKLIGEQWRTMTDEEKAPYQKRHLADKKRYEKEKEALEK